MMVEAFGRATLEKGRHSRMAELVAIGRAVHQFLDAEVIFSDPLAERIIGEKARRWMGENLAWQKIEGLRRTRVLLAIRSRYSEEMLLESVAAGTTQYVILGAGLDTFAYRRPDLAATLTIYEVDHPRTQNWKRERLTEAGITVPANVRFVPSDLAAPALADSLAGSGFRRDAAAFFSWLGVTYYLVPDAVLGTLRFIGSQSAASRVVFDFAVDTSVLPPEFDEIMTRVRGYIATTGEPWRSSFVPGELVISLREMGFRRIERFHADDLARRYLGRTDDLGPLVALMSAGT